MYYTYVKRCLDIFLAGITSIVLLPFMLVIAVLIKLDSPGPVFFKQRRIGLHKNYFNIYKFRTMKVDAPKDTPTHLLEHPDSCITRVGKVLRKTSLDELPQIPINILLKGNMSICGPRPALWNQEDLIMERDQYGANDIKPGLTGWAQAHGRDELEIKEKARLDGYYTQSMSLLMDVRCMVDTVVSVLKHDGVVEGGTGTMHNTSIATAEREV